MKFPLRAWHKTLNNKGLTLLEIMVVLGLIAALVTMAVPRLASNSYKLKSTVRKLSVLSRELHNYAKLKQATYRLVISMQSAEETEDGEPIYEYWVEKTTKEFLIADADDDTEAKEDEDGNPIDPDGFQMDTRLLKGKKQLPGGMRFDRVEFVGKDEIDSGQAYIHFLPQGLAEEAAIHIGYDEKLNWTIAIHPLTGRADVLSRDVDLEEIRDQ